jgi:outer membrane protein OmpA-like peptidoglycan-associated protein
MKFSDLFFATAITLAALNGPAVRAQDNSNLSAEEIRELFEKQKTRGLVIAPGTDQGAVVPVTPGVTPPPATFVELDKADQVNIQIRFDFDSARLRDEEKPKLVALCEAMKSVDVPMFRIVGHTDSSGTAEYNEKLSLLRAEEVKRHLVSECGIPETRLEAVGVGEAFPFDATDPRADANRRVEFQAMS